MQRSTRRSAPPQRHRALAAVGSLGVMSLVVVASAAAQQPPATPGTTAPPADPAAPTTVDPAAPPTTAKPASTKPAPGRRTPSRDPEVLAADNRSPAGLIVGISPALDVVPVTSKEYDGAAKQRDADAADLADATHRIQTAEQHLLELEADRLALVGLIGRSEARQKKLTETAATLESSLRTLAIDRYVSGSSDDLYPDPNETLEEQLDRSHRSILGGEAERQLRLQITTVDERLAASAEQLVSRQGELDANADETATTEGDLADARIDADVATAAVVGAEEELRAARPMTEVAGSDLPLVALDAYWRATGDLAVTRPSCGLQWWALAAIGRSESNHGRSSGGQAAPDGKVTVPVYGVPLDGTGGTKLVPDSDKGVLDLDPLLDRAVGVMQFLPGTWKRWAEDESGDKVADPQNIYDAALASGKLLCSSASALDTDEGLRKAYFAYNHSDDYVERVLTRAHEYEQLPVPARPVE